MTLFNRDALLGGIIIVLVLLLANPASAKTQPFKFPKPTGAAKVFKVKHYDYLKPEIKPEPGYIKYRDTQVTYIIATGEIRSSHDLKMFLAELEATAGTPELISKCFDFTHVIEYPSEQGKVNVEICLDCNKVKVDIGQQKTTWLYLVKPVDGKFSLALERYLSPL
jgi:hypothetical protein